MTSNRLVRQPKDMLGLKLRVLQSKVAPDSFRPYLGDFLRAGAIVDHHALEAALAWRRGVDAGSPHDAQA